MNMKKTRAEAIKALDDYYFTGKPCKHGHISKRHTISGTCYTCIINSSIQYMKKQRNEFRRLQKEKLNEKQAGA